jgi:hypothetical protein
MCHFSIEKTQRLLVATDLLYMVIDADRAGNRPTVFKRTSHRRASSPKFRLYIHVPIDYLRSWLLSRTKALFQKYA